jgi:high-affinity iron transporter
LSLDSFVGWIRRLRGIRQEHMVLCKQSHLSTLE